MTRIRTHRSGLDLLDIEIGKRIRARRLLLGMTQRKLATALGVAWQQMHKYERSISRISASRLATVADALGVPVSYFFGDVPAQTPQCMPNDLMERTETLQLMRLYYAISDETMRRQVLAIVEAVAEATASPSAMLSQDSEKRTV